MSIEISQGIKTIYRSSNFLIVELIRVGVKVVGVEVRSKVTRTHRGLEKTYD